MRYNIHVPYEINTIDDLVRILKEHPEWLERLREVLLTEEERRLPAMVQELTQTVRELVQVVQELTQSHHRALERLERLEQSHQQLVQSHQQLVQSHQQAIERLDRLEQSHLRLEETLQHFMESSERRFERLEAFMVSAEQRFERIETDLAKLKGYALENHYRFNAPAVFGYYVSKPKVVSVVELLEKLKGQGHTFSKEEWQKLIGMDVLLSARHPQTGEALYFTVEVSWRLYPDDVERALERAELLRTRGVNIYPAVAGETITDEAQALALQKQVFVAVDGALLSEGFSD